MLTKLGYYLGASLAAGRPREGFRGGGGSAGGGPSFSSRRRELTPAPLSMDIKITTDKECPINSFYYTNKYKKLLSNVQYGQ